MDADAPFDDAIYILQTINVNDDDFILFFDTGCSDFVSRHDAVERIGNAARQEVPGPIVLGGVGDCQTKSPYGIYQVKLPLHNGTSATFSGVCLECFSVFREDNINIPHLPVAREGVQ